MTFDHELLPGPSLVTATVYTPVVHLIYDHENVLVMLRSDSFKMITLVRYCGDDGTKVKVSINLSLPKLLDRICPHEVLFSPLPCIFVPDHPKAVSL